MDSALNSNAIKELDLEFAKLARDIPRPKVRERGEEGEEEDLGGLC